MQAESIQPEVRNLSSRKLWEILRGAEARADATARAIAQQAREELRQRDALASYQSFRPPH